jgi:hypothetical protein
VLLQLNQIARPDQPIFFCIVGVENLYKFDNMAPTVVFPKLGKKRTYDDMYGNTMAEVEGFDPALYPRGALMLVPVENIIAKKSVEHNVDDAATVVLTKRQKWDKFVGHLKEEIHLEKFAPKKADVAISIARKMLACPKFQFSKNGAMVQIKDSPKTLVPTLDFLTVAARQAAPNEPPPNPIFVSFVKIMKEKGTAMSSIKNRNLLYKINKRELNKMPREFGKKMK